MGRTAKRSDGHGDPHLVDLRSIVEATGRSDRTIRRYAADGKIPYYRDPGSGRMRFDVQEVREALEPKRHGAA